MLFCGAICGAVHSADATPTNIGNVTSITLDNGVYDSLYATNEVIENWDGSISYEWNYNTVLFAEFKNNLYAGNVDFSIDTVTSLKIKRRKLGEYLYKTICEIPIHSNADFTFQRYDYLAASNQEYEYALVPCFGGTDGAAKSNVVKSEFEGVFLVEKDISYQAFLNMSLTHKRVRGGSSITTLGRRTPFHVSNGLSNYTAGSLSATYIAPNGDGSYDVDNGWKYREDINDFLTNGKPKILKNFEGKIWIVYVLEDTINESEKDHYQNIITSFDWFEVGDANNISDLYINGFIDGDSLEFENDSTGLSSGSMLNGGSTTGTNVSDLYAQVQNLQSQLSQMDQVMVNGIAVNNEKIKLTSKRGVISEADAPDSVIWEE